MDMIRHDDVSPERNTFSDTALAILDHSSMNLVSSQHPASTGTAYRDEIKRRIVLLKNEFQSRRLCQAHQLFGSAADDGGLYSGRLTGSLRGR
jgi:hypothetical protein